MLTIADEIGVPLVGSSKDRLAPLSKEGQDAVEASKCANTLLQDASINPPPQASPSEGTGSLKNRRKCIHLTEERKRQLKSTVLAYLGKTDCDTVSVADLQCVIESAQSLPPSALNPAFKSHGVALMDYLMDQAAATLCKTDAEDTVHGQQSQTKTKEDEQKKPVRERKEVTAEQHEQIETFVKRWRAHFLEYMKPKYLPQHWSVHAKVKATGSNVIKRRRDELHVVTS
jgi:hypothetical protein